MPIMRKDAGDYRRVKGKVKGPAEREPDDYDLAWDAVRVYVLDAHEWFDPHTSTKYHDGISRHAMYGPAVVVCNTHGGGMRTDHHDVNDPTVWAYVRRLIAERHPVEGELPNDERAVKLN